ncbi:MAG: CopG family transcriptional regulator [Elusimicrobia bacterium CG1_02_63_36]|nr:MAG: CopG family transcriptional regulator [Elusimicrobia bacterium CG1_02_63_36]PIP82309.1 MAG: CopG family transcriptional regulator [Elusimicrobia bacterium CG22_combo_CG10-13_8_21_14_all_63_91]PJA15391.1 MAG: CopG family transcriptional regulator [Elusimicrobia bacterium CG_4_10_14_0_2_um_filter_63_34]PJB27044.1 MAG: CopG family transcriptional regulator [Elusimicrobia bacterium CG_4_9_14_3_um_filter_62_55]
MTAAQFDRKFERGEDIAPYLDLKKAIVVQRVNVDFPSWMVDMLDQEAVKLNVSRQAIIKMWIRERLDPGHRITR